MALPNPLQVYDPLYNKRIVFKDRANYKRYRNILFDGFYSTISLSNKEMNNFFKGYRTYARVFVTAPLSVQSFYQYISMMDELLENGTNDKPVTLFVRINKIDFRDNIIAQPEWSSLRNHFGRIIFLLS